jgi:hypothetical protein
LSKKDAEMTVPNDEDRLRRGEETDRWLKLAWKNAPESVNLHLPIHWSSNAVILLSPHDRRMLSLQTLSSIQTQSMQTKGRHAGWAKIQDCVKACRALSKSPDTGYFSCTESEVHTMVERCLELGLIDTKHCDDANGSIQQYVKASLVYEDYMAYRMSLSAEKNHPEIPILCPERGWWTKDRKGNYPPDGPSPKAAEQFASVIERFHKGIQVRHRLDRSGGFTMARL